MVSREQLLDGLAIGLVFLFFTLMFMGVVVSIAALWVLIKHGSAL